MMLLTKIYLQFLQRNCSAILVLCQGTAGAHNCVMREHFVKLCRYVIGGRLMLTSCGQYDDKDGRYMLLITSIFFKAHFSSYGVFFFVLLLIVVLMFFLCGG